MKKILKAITIIISTAFVACAPPTETRAYMDNTSDRMSDSIAKLIDSCLAIPAHELIGTGSPIASSASSFTPATPPK